MRSITISKGHKPLTFNEVEAIQFVAQFLEVSEYEVFQLAHKDWYGKRMIDTTMNYRFENYMEDAVVPFWVWNFVKGVIEKYEKDQVNPSDYGIEPTVLTKSQKKLGWLYLIGVILFALFYCWIVSQVEPNIQINFG